MTVDELIAQLAQYPGYYKVVLNVQDFATMTEAEGVYPGHYNEDRYELFTFNGNGKMVDVNAVAICGRY